MSSIPTKKGHYQKITGYKKKKNQKRQELTFKIVYAHTKCMSTIQIASRMIQS